MVHAVFGRSNPDLAGFVEGSLMGTSKLKASSKIVVWLTVKGV